MIGWLYRVLIGSFYICRHKWETEAKINVFANGTDRPVATKYVLRCEHCGNIKKREV